MLPALLFGWNASVSADEFVVEVGHQFGGYACRQQVLTGLLFPLRGNIDQAKRDPGPLLTGLRAIAESQANGRSHRTATSLPIFDAWGYTSGEDMTGPDLRNWERLLEHYFDLPPLVSGAEALLTFEETDASDLIGWQAVAGALQGMRGLSLVQRTDLDAVMRCGPHDRASAAKLYFLWENSD